MVGTEQWTTLPERDGLTSQDTGESCPDGWRKLHPQLDHYQRDSHRLLGVRIRRPWLASRARASGTQNPVVGWARNTEDFEEGPVVGTTDTVYTGFGFEGLAGASNRAAFMAAF